MSKIGFFSSKYFGLKVNSCQNVGFKLKLVKIMFFKVKILVVRLKYVQFLVFSSQNFGLKVTSCQNMRF